MRMRGRNKDYKDVKSDDRLSGSTVVIIAVRVAPIFI